ncbi:MAG: hypothetical protein KGO96_07355 [Elusimicrobia bacterium]|nr:hypothetical protein [Elusimicrobiota bacterium]
MNDIDKGYMVFYSHGGWQYDYFESKEIDEVAEFICELENDYTDLDYDVVSYSKLSPEDSKLLELYKEKKKSQ